LKKKITQHPLKSARLNLC